MAPVRLGVSRGVAAVTTRQPGPDRLWKAIGAVQVLVVEDDNAIGEPLATGLRREGFDVILVQTAAAALSAPPADLVLSTWDFPTPTVSRSADSYAHAPRSR